MHIPYALIGGYSAIIYGSPYTTQDIDFVAEPKQITVELLDKLKKIGLEPTEDYSDIEYLRSFGQFVHKDTGIVLHIFPEVAGFKIAGGIEIEIKELEGKQVKVCTPEDYLVMRATLWDDEDKLKAVVLARAQKKLNLNYLMRRAKEENVTKRIEWILKEAEIDE